ncbi:MAG TPA: serine protease [Solirubrobacteraceae bacterium]
MRASASGSAAQPVPLRARILAALAAVALLSAPQAAGAEPGAHAAIVGGAAAAAGQLPWLAYIHRAEGGGAYEWCTGTVVAANLVLTAAHCVEDVSSGTLDPAADFTVVTGSPDWSDAAHDEVSAVTQVIPDKTSIETSNNGINVVGDAALLQLTTSTTAPSVTLYDGSDAALSAPGTPATIAGWGITSPTAGAGPETLQQGPSVIQEQGWCYDEQQTQFQATAQMCAIDAPSYATSACDGDSGGPLLVEASGAWTEVGITSSSATCDTQRPDIFTRVDYVRAWVEGWIAVLPAPPPPAAPQPSAGPSTPAPAPTTSLTVPDVGYYSGKSAQRAGRVAVTLEPRGLTSLRLRFNLSCPHGSWRGPFTTAERVGPLALKLSAGAWRFSTTFRDRRGWHYAVAGAFSTFGTAHGTLAVKNGDASCATKVLDWRAAIHGG